MGKNEDRQSRPLDDDAASDAANDSVRPDSDEGQLLEAVLRETMGNVNERALEIILSVARKSAYPDTTSIEAVQEIVTAIIRHCFGNRPFPRRLIYRIACTLIETPEATIKLERLWQEGRSGG